MEFRARYTLIGLFSLSVIIAAFAFIYWLETVGGFERRAFYKVRFDHPVSGLTRGSRVLFNGIHIGEVSDLNIDFDQPEKLFATLSVNKDIPIREDTYIGIDYQSLTGGAAIVLSGRGTTAKVLQTSGSDIPLLIADPSIGLNWTQSASLALGKINAVLDENAEPLNGSIKNIKAFTEILSNNSDRIENILKGLENFAGGVKDKSKDVIFDLEVPTTFPAPDTSRNWQLVIAEPTVQLAFNTDKVLKKAKAGELTTYPVGRWSDNLPNFFQAKLLQSFENAGYANSVSKPGFGGEPEYQLTIDIRSFHLSTISTPKAEIIFNAKLVDQSGKIIQSRLFTSNASAEDDTITAATASLSSAFKKSMTDLVMWTAEKI